MYMRRGPRLMTTLSKSQSPMDDTKEAMETRERIKVSKTAKQVKRLVTCTGGRGINRRVR